MDDKNKDIIQHRNYLKYLDQITDLIDMLPDIDDNTFSFYENINKMIANEDVRINKKLKQLEKERM